MEQKNIGNRSPRLGADNKIPVEQLPDSVRLSLEYKGTWNANTNSPDLPASTPEQGWVYIVSVAGNTSLGGITDWAVGDWAIYNGATWQKVDNSTANYLGNVTVPNLLKFAASVAAAALGDVGANVTTGRLSFYDSVLAAADEIVGLAATQTLANKTLTTPTIGSFVNAGHNHSNAAGGGTISHGDLTSGGTITHANIDRLFLRMGGQNNKCAALVDRTGLPAYTYAAGTITANVVGALPVQDGITLVAGNYFLLADPAGTAHAHHGVYILLDAGGATAWSAARVSWMAHDQTDVGAVLAFVYQGTSYAGVWVMQEGSITVGTGTSIWVRFVNTLDHDLLDGLSGGASNDYYHFTQVEHTALLAYAHFKGTAGAASSNPPTAAEALAFLTADADFGFMEDGAGHNFVVYRDGGTCYHQILTACV